MADSYNEKRNQLGRIWNKLCRFRFIRRKLSTKNLVRLCEETATHKKTLVVHSEDVDYQPYFPNSFSVTKRKDKPADMHVDLYYTELNEIDRESYEVIFCTGLLEHIPDPQRIVDDFNRILKPGGELIVSASAVFSFHEGPNNFYHFTPYGFQLLFKDWTKIKMLRGASQPFETIAILMQRILIQAKMFPLIRPIVELLCLIIPVFDYFVQVQYDTAGKEGKEHEIDSMLPSNVQAIVIK